MKISNYIRQENGGYCCLICNNNNKVATLREVKLHIKDNHIYNCDYCELQVLESHNCSKANCATCSLIHEKKCDFCKGDHCVSLCDRVGTFMDCSYEQISGSSKK